jgi:hypothetical protein
MALIVITIKDQEDGSVAVQLQDHPSCTPDQTDFTPAQHVSAIALNAIHNQLNAVGKNTIDLSAAPSAQPPHAKKLTLVGADELPIT